MLKRNTKITVLLAISGLSCVGLSIMFWSANLPHEHEGVTYFGFLIGTNMLVSRASSVWVLRVLGLIAGPLTIAAAFAKPLSRPLIGMGVALPLIIIVPFMLLVGSDTSTMLASMDQGSGLLSAHRANAWAIAIGYSILFLLSALSISFGHKIRAFAPFREETA